MKTLSPQTPYNPEHPRLKPLPELKFNIRKLLYVGDRKQEEVNLIIRRILLETDLSETTFYRIMFARKGTPQVFKLEHAIAIARILNCEVKELYNDNGKK